MQIDEETCDEIHIITISGYLDSNTAPLFEERAMEAIARGVKGLIIDFASLEYISSAGLRVILKLAKEMMRLEGKLVACSMADYIREVFEISGFDSFIPIAESRQKAQELV